mgnify:CR=1 FL=1
MAHLGLTDSVDTSETLFQPVRVPWKIVIDHEVRALQIDALARGIGGDHDAHVGILSEPFLGAVAFLTTHTALDRDHRFVGAQQHADS